MLSVYFGQQEHKKTTRIIKQSDLASVLLDNMLGRENRIPSSSEVCVCGVCCGAAGLCDRNKNNSCCPLRGSLNLCSSAANCLHRCFGILSAAASLFLSPAAVCLWQ